jgi:hypothetical protein
MWYCHSRFSLGKPKLPNQYAKNIAVIGIGGETAANPATMLTTGTDEYWNPIFLGNNKIVTVGWMSSVSLDQIYAMNAADGSSLVQLTDGTLNDMFNWYED